MQKKDSKGRFIKGSESYWKGKKFSNKYKKKLSDVHKKLYLEGKNIPPSRKGIPSPTKGISRLDMIGELNHNWRGGISKNIRPTNGIKYKQWREAVFKRDDFVCQDCGRRGVYLEAHHIKEWKNYPKLRYKVFNGLTLCKKCHNKTKKGIKT